MQASKVEVLFGKIAVSCGYITDAQLDRAIEEQSARKQPQHLGRLMVEMGLLTEEELMTVLAIQRENRSRAEMSPAVRKLGMTLGALAVESGYCSEQEVHACIREQARLERFNLFFRLGEVLVSKNVLTIQQVHDLLKTQNITILGCPGCFSKFNVLNYKQGMTIDCPKCGAGLELPDSLTSIKVDANIDNPQQGGGESGGESSPKRPTEKTKKREAPPTVAEGFDDYTPPKR